MEFKDSVYMGKFQLPKMLDALMTIQQILKELDKDYVITSICDDSPNRLPDSKHRDGLAFDFRLKHMSTVEKNVCYYKAKLLFTMMPYQIVMEDDHFHVEYEEHEMYLSRREGNNKEGD
jgi:hypothetical protein